jgi:hypothetical protein
MRACDFHWLCISLDGLPTARALDQRRLARIW